MPLEVRHRNDGDGRLLSLELIHRPDLRPFWQHLPQEIDLKVVRRDDEDVRQRDGRDRAVLAVDQLLQEVFHNLLDGGGLGSARSRATEMRHRLERDSCPLENGPRVVAQGEVKSVKRDPEKRARRLAALREL
jgi:hypothetical protein